MLENGFECVFGQPPPNYWTLLHAKCEHPGCPGSSEERSIGLMLYGDESTALGSTFMAFHWQSDHSELAANSQQSRYLITVIEKERYVVRDGINVTIQGITSHIVASLNLWREQGLQGLKASVVVVKGDWKFIKELCNLQRFYSRDAICFLCEASKSMDCPYTDTSASAKWRDTYLKSDPWTVAPEITKLADWSLLRVSIDLMHTFHLGLGRDIIASTLLILLRSRGLVAGSSVKERMMTVSALIKAFAKQKQRAFPAKWCLTNQKLGLKTNKFAEFHGKAWQAGVIIQWLASFFEATPCADPNVVACVALSNHLVTLMISAREHGVHLTDVEMQQIKTVGEGFLKSYLSAHTAYRGWCPYKMYNVRPKFHMMQHLIESADTGRNPASSMCFMDEDWIKNVMRVVQATHKKVAARNTLHRWLLGLLPALTEGKRRPASLLALASAVLCMCSSPTGFARAVAEMQLASS